MAHPLYTKLSKGTSQPTGEMVHGGVKPGASSAAWRGFLSLGARALEPKEVRTWRAGGKAQHRPSPHSTPVCGHQQSPQQTRGLLSAEKCDLQPVGQGQRHPSMATSFQTLEVCLQKRLPWRKETNTFRNKENSNSHKNEKSKISTCECIFFSLEIYLCLMNLTPVRERGACWEPAGE